MQKQQAVKDEKMVDKYLKSYNRNIIEKMMKVVPNYNPGCDPLSELQ